MLSLSVYSAFIRNAFLAMLAYRLRYYTGIVTYILFVSVHYFIWSAVFHDKAPGEKINGFTLEEMITYLAVGWMARSFYFSTIDEDIDDMVKTGQVSVYLLRPVNFHIMMLAQAAGESLFRMLFFSLPIGIAIVSLFPVGLPAGFLNSIYFLLATLGSFVVLAEINFQVGLLAFSFKSTQGLSRAKYFLIQLFSGLLLPLTFFPEWMQRILEFLPFKIITYTPLQFYLGHVTPARVLPVFLNLILWIAVLMLISRWMWGREVRRLTLQGG